MKVTFHSYPTPHLLLEDVFSDSILESVWSEVNNLHGHLLLPKQTGSAHSSNKLLKRNSGLYLYPHYRNNCKASPIINALHDVVFNPQTIDAWGVPYIKNMVKVTNWETVLLSYYNQGDHYRSHHDVAVFTTLLWLWNKPKAFDGGNLKLDEYDHIITAQNNCGVMFLSAEKHSVDTVNIRNEDVQNPGRYCISHFCGVKNV